MAEGDEEELQVSVPCRAVFDAEIELAQNRHADSDSIPQTCFVLDTFPNATACVDEMASDAGVEEITPHLKRSSIGFKCASQFAISHCFCSARAFLQSASSSDVRNG